MLRLDREKILRQAAKLLEAENRRLVERNLELQRRLLQARGLGPAERQMRLVELERQLTQRNQMLFGRFSEKRPSSWVGAEPAPRKPQSGHGPREQKQLPVREEVFKLDKPDQQCPK